MNWEVLCIKMIFTNIQVSETFPTNCTLNLAFNFNQIGIGKFIQFCKRKQSCRSDKLFIVCEIC